MVSAFVLALRYMAMLFKTFGVINSFFMLFFLYHKVIAQQRSMMSLVLQMR
jgi:hypothetical protein